MKIVSEIESYDLTARLAAKAPAFYGFGSETSSKTINVTNAFDGQCILIESNLTFTLVHAGLRTNGVVRFVQVGNDTSTIQTSDDAVPSQYSDISAGGYVDWTWAGDKWVLTGVYTF
jgi:hypothetical protein